MASVPFLVGLLVIVALAFGAFRLGVLDLPGSALAGLFGVAILFATDIGWFVLLAGFTAAGFLVTRIGYETKRVLAANEPHKGRRGAANVLANGATATVVAVAGLWLAESVLALPFTVAVAVAAADTFASELGSLAGRPVLITDPRRIVPPGTNGGVTWGGTFASALGAAAVGLAAHLLVPLPLVDVPFVVLLGMVGSFIDSVLGATWEATPGVHDGPLTKGDVNFISITLPTLFVFVPSVFGWF